KAASAASSAWSRSTSTPTSPRRRCGRPPDRCGGADVVFTVGIDMGGTFTDGFVTDGVRTTVFKVPTTHFDLSQSVLGCLRRGGGRLCPRGRRSSARTEPPG